MEYFIVANSFAAPFVSDRSEDFQEADSPEQALELFAARYRHPARLFAADCFASATDYHKHKPPLARWLCNREIALQDAVKGKASYVLQGVAPNRFKIGDELIVVDKPYEGKIVPVPEPRR
jgi:hypothetical protein